MKNCPSFTVVPVNHPAKYEAFSFVGIGRTKVEPYSTVTLLAVPSGSVPPLRTNVTVQVSFA